MKLTAEDVKLKPVCCEHLWKFACNGAIKVLENFKVVEIRIILKGKPKKI